MQVVSLGQNGNLALMINKFLLINHKKMKVLTNQKRNISLAGSQVQQ